MEKKKVLSILLTIMLCISIFFASDCMNARSMKSLERMVSYISIIAGAISIVDWIMEKEE